MSGPSDSEAQKVMGARLQVIRRALGLSQDEMAGMMGVGVTTLSAWESGRNQIDIVKLARSATRWGFTTDWVARGDLSGLRKDLADKVEAIMAERPAPRRGRPPSKPRLSLHREPPAAEPTPAPSPKRTANCPTPMRIRERG
jgi:transcriptional regulator with XRE-family HTH domain